MWSELNLVAIPLLGNKCLISGAQIYKGPADRAAGGQPVCDMGREGRALTLAAPACLPLRSGQRCARVTVGQTSFEG